MVKIKVIKVEPWGSTDEAKANAKCAWLTYEINGEIQKPKIRLKLSHKLEEGKEYEGELKSTTYTPQGKEPEQQVWFELPFRGGGSGGPRTDPQRNAIEEKKLQHMRAATVFNATVEYCDRNTPEGQEINDEFLVSTLKRFGSLYKAAERSVQP